MVLFATIMLLFLLAVCMVFGVIGGLFGVGLLMLQLRYQKKDVHWLNLIWQIEVSTLAWTSSCAVTGVTAYANYIIDQLDVTNPVLLGLQKIINATFLLSVLWIGPLENLVKSVAYYHVTLTSTLIAGWFLLPFYLAFFKFWSWIFLQFPSSKRALLKLTWQQRWGTALMSFAGALLFVWLGIWFQSIHD